jgi:site-specific DNA recombinase
MKKPGATTRRNGTVRCAIYTRKSSEEGLEQEFNSLQAQREACEAFINSQRQEGWVCLPAAYDDGGFSGATMDRPALQRLLGEITAGRVDTVVVYKIDRLTRSLADFAKIVEILDARGASFVSVTQQFNTTTSMGRLTLNVLLSFAQFEREVIGERIRDKIAASKKKGMWMGGVPALGYRAQDRKLVVVDSEAEIVRSIFRRYAGLGSVRLLKDELEAQLVKSKSDERLGWQAIRLRRALPDAAEPHLSRPDRSQGTILSRRTPADHRSAALGCGSGATCRQMPPSTTQAHGRVSRACSPACCLTATATG